MNIIYRKALDGGQVTKKDKNELLQAFSRRGFTTRPFSVKMPEMPALPAARPQEASPPASSGRSFSFDAYIPLKKGKKRKPKQLAAQVMNKKQALSVLRCV